MLDVVEFGELTTVIRGEEGLEFFQGLASEVVAVHEEQDSLGTGVFDEAIDEAGCGEGFATAGRHLDECSLAIFGEGAFKVGDGFDLAVAEIFGDERREVLQPGAEGVGLFDPFAEGFRSVERKDAARAGRGIALIAEAGFNAGGLVDEGGLAAVERGVFLDVVDVPLGLVFNRGKNGPFRLCFDHADSLAIHEEHVVHGTGGGRVFPNRLSSSRAGVHRLVILHNPTRSHELPVDVLTCGLFGLHGNRPG